MNFLTLQIFKNAPVNRKVRLQYRNPAKTSIIKDFIELLDDRYNKARDIVSDGYFKRDDMDKHEARRLTNAAIYSLTCISKFFARDFFYDYVKCELYEDRSELDILEDARVIYSKMSRKVMIMLSALVSFNNTYSTVHELLKTAYNICIRNDDISKNHSYSFLDYLLIKQNRDTFKAIYEKDGKGIDCDKFLIRTKEKIEKSIKEINKYIEEQKTGRPGSDESESTEIRLGQYKKAITDGKNLWTHLDAPQALLNELGDYNAILDILFDTMWQDKKRLETIKNSSAAYKRSTEEFQADKSTEEIEEFCETEETRIFFNKLREYFCGNEITKQINNRLYYVLC